MTSHNQPMLSAQQLRAFLDHNPDLKFESHNFLKTEPDAQFDWAGLDPERHKEALRSYQRLARLGASLETAERLLGAGIHSAQQIARTPKRRFVRNAAADLGLDAEATARLHQCAVSVQNKTFQLWATARAAIASPVYRNSRFSNVSADVAQMFEDLPSYQELFGTLDYCACEECRSIFGPAAYLVDLQRIIDEYVTAPNAKTIPPGLSFPERRPDIGNIELTCANTNTLVSYLQIVDERLIAYAQAALQLPSPADVLRQLATALIYPRALPFNTPLNRITLLLAQAGAPYDQVLAAWGSPATVFVPRRLGLSPDSQAILTAPANTADTVAPYYNVAPADLGTLSDPDTFMADTGLDFAGLLSLLQEDLSPAELAAGLQANFFINAGLGGKVVTLDQPAGTQQWVLENLGVPALDAINRQLRLADALGWSQVEVDWALRAAAGGGTPVLAEDDEALVAVGAMAASAQALSLTGLQATALLGPIKTYGQGADQAGSQFDRLFNTPALVSQAGTYHPNGNPLNRLYTDAPLNWTPGSTAPADVAAITRVLPGLGLSLTDANALGVALYGTQTAQPLDVTVLSALYRHALLATALAIPMSRYLMLLELLGQTGPGPFNENNLGALISVAQWMQAAGINAYQLEYLINGRPSVYVALPYQPSSVPAWQKSLIQQASTGGADPEAAVAAQIAVLFGIQQTQLQPILNMAVAAVTLPDPNLGWAQTFLAVDAEGAPLYPQYAAQVLDWCARWLVLQAAAGLSDAVMANVSGFPAAYGLPANFAPVPLRAVRRITSVKAIISGYGDTQNKLLLYIQQVSSPPPGIDPLDTLYQATGWPQAQARQLLDGPVKSITPLADQLAAMASIFKLMAATATDPTLMGQIAALGDARAADAWADYEAVSQKVQAAVQSRYGATWEEIAGAVEGKLEVAERDALLALVLTELHSRYADITTARNVHEFLLIDVEMGPETQISYVKEALNACQLYLQRCRLGLELGVLDLEIAPAWWEWMMNYRVWEANREIFVYPENYLVPTLRPTTTPQFQTLQNELQQSDVTSDYVAGAFSDYMEGFVAAAQLQPVGVYRSKIKDARQGTVDCTFVFAKSNTDPITFYWAQQIDNMPWTPWEKIDISINADAVSGVYAFGRLFVFWLEVTKGRGSSIEATGQSASVSTNSISYTVALRYSFLNTQNNWVQPQTLTADEIVYYASTGSDDVSLAHNPVFSGLFDFTKMTWLRPAVLHATAGDFRTPPDTQTAEKICVMYGPFLPGTVSPINPGSPPTTTEADALAFYRELKDAVLNHNQIVSGELTGNQLLRPALVIDGLLADSVLFHKEEFYLFDAYLGPATLNRVNAQLSTTDSSLLLLSSPTTLADNLIADPNVAVIGQATQPLVSVVTFITPSINSTVANQVLQQLLAAKILVPSSGAYVVDAAALSGADLLATLQPLVHLGTFSAAQVMDVQKALFASVAGAALFDNVNPITSRVATVKNQPGWFVLYSGGEVFLLTPRQDPAAGLQPVFSEIDESMTIAPPPLTPVSFVSSYTKANTTYTIDAALSQKAYAALVSYGIINGGIFNASIPYSFIQLALKPVFNDNPDQLQLVFNVLNNAPLVTPDAFTDPALGIGSDVSQAIYNSLSSYSVIDVVGRVSPNLLTPAQVRLALGQLIMAGSLTAYQVPGVYDLLNRATRPVALTYQNKGDASHFTAPGDFVFTVTRLSTAAAAKLDAALFAGSVDALLSTQTQGYPVFPVLPFSRLGPNPNAAQTGKLNVIPPTALDGTQVDFDGFYGQYFWEIFFHVPRLVAYMLGNNQKFQDAITWLQYIFNPTVRPQPVTADLLVEQTGGAINAATAALVIGQLQSTSIGNPAAPVLDAAGQVNPALTQSTDLSFLTQAPSNLSVTQVLMVQAVLLNYELATPASRFWLFFPFRNYTQQTLTQMLSDDNPAMRVYNDDPFDPYAIARLRIGAFEKATVMQYIDALIQWGDMLFTLDTWEYITAASLLYLYASDLLGPRPVEVGECPGSAAPVTFNQIKQEYPEGVPQFLIDLEHLTPGGVAPTPPVIGHTFNDLNVYFCVPENSSLMAYWDTIDDRLYKIEHSMNIKGQVRTLALFEPPLNPLDLVRAAAAGINVQGTAAGGPPTTTPYRFASAVAYAQRTADATAGFGAELLAALEKKDAEGLSMLQTNQASQVVQMTVLLKQQRVAELGASINALQASLDSANYRVQFYGAQIAQNLLPEEQTSLDAMTTALVFNTAASVLNTAGAIGYAVPQAGSPFAMTYGGEQIGNSITASAGVAQIGAEIANYISTRASTMAGYARRRTDWQYQQQLAQYDVQQIEASLLAAQQQLAQAQQDLAITNLQVKQDQALADYLTKKFTSQQLYAWMSAQLSAVYFQSFHLALTAAKAAEWAYQYETDTDATFVAFDYWNSLYKGLLAGEGLKSSLDQMEGSYRTQNTRRFEIVKNVSLALTAPEALMTLKETGYCEFALPEELYDYDYPGQYARKITSVSVSIPALLGPYDTVKAILTQSSNQVVTLPDIKVVQYLLGLSTQPPTKGLRTDWMSKQSVAISQAVDDSGMFVLNFGDERYLPFENTGAVSKWSLEMPLTTNRFNFALLSDVILTVRYTALSDGSLKQQVQQALGQAPYEGGVYVDVLRQQPSAWSAFMADRSSTSAQTLSLAVDISQLAYYKSLTVTTLLVRLDLGAGVGLQDGGSFMTVTANQQQPQTPKITQGVATIGDLNWPTASVQAPWLFAFDLTSPDIKPLLTDGYLDPAKLVDLEVIVVYDAKVF